MNYMIENYRKGIDGFILNNTLFDDGKREKFIEENGMNNIKMMLLAELFGFTTDDDSMSVKIGKDIYEVMKVVVNNENFTYITDPEKYYKFIILINILERYNWTNCGTSIRGTWFDGEKPTWENLYFEGMGEPKYKYSDDPEFISWIEYLGNDEY